MNSLKVIRRNNGERDPRLYQNVETLVWCTVWEREGRDQLRCQTQREM